MNNTFTSTTLKRPITNHGSGRSFRVPIIVVTVVLVVILICGIAYELTPYERAIRHDQNAYKQVAIPQNWVLEPVPSHPDDEEAPLWDARSAGYTYTYTIPDMSQTDFLNNAMTLLRNAGYDPWFTQDGTKVATIANANGVRGYNAKSNTTITASSFAADEATFDIQGKF